MSEKSPQKFVINFELYQKIIAGNLDVHIKDAPHYDVFHGELFNWYEQRRIVRDLETVLQLTEGRKVLDVGCGTGNLTLKLAAKNCDLTAVDLSQPMLEILMQKLHKQKIQAMVFCENIDTYLERVESHFDIVTLSSVLHHLPNYLDTLDKLTWLTNPGGVIYITHEPSGIAAHPNSLRNNFYALDSLLWRYISGAWRIQRPTIDWEYSDYHAHHGFGSPEVINFLEERGFEIKKQIFYTATMKLGLSNAIDNILFRPKTHFCAIAQKRR